MEIFAHRPMGPHTRRYCADNIEHLPALREVYGAKLDKWWTELVEDESVMRVVHVCDGPY